MSLTIGAIKSRGSETYSSDLLFFEDGPVYWFCYPSFEALAQLTGELIDLYGSAEFGGSTLDDLARCLVDVRKRAADLSDEWDQLVGWNAGSRVAPVDPPTPVYELGRKADLMAAIDAFAVIVSDAQRDGMWIACGGD